MDLTADNLRDDMLNHSKYRNGRGASALPTTRADKYYTRDLKPPIHRQLVTLVSRRPALSVFVLVFMLTIAARIFGMISKTEVSRNLGGSKVVARNWQELPLSIDIKGTALAPIVLILCPMKNSIEHIWHFFQLLDSLEYPRDRLQVGILVSDSVDRTYERALELADERQYRRPKKQRYSRISVYNKDFNLGAEVSKISNNVGKERHEFGVQIARRKVLAQSRTWLMNTALTPEVDWALWIDVDVVEYDKNLLNTLLDWSNKTDAAVVVPNCVWKTYNEQGSYDRNNWAETAESIAFKDTLGSEDILIEGYETLLDTHRLNMASMYPPTSSTPEMMLLDGVGGCTVLINADLHRIGAIFPSWPVDHQIETEGFAQIVRRLGGKMVGLPKYYVYHGLYG